MSRLGILQEAREKEGECNLIQAPAEVHLQHNGWVGLSEEAEAADEFAEPIIAGNENSIQSKVEDGRRKPVVGHLHPINLHILDQFVLLFQNDVVHENWQTQSSQDGIYDITDAIDCFLSFCSDFGFEWHELHPCYNMCVIENGLGVSLINFVR